MTESITQVVMRLGKAGKKQEAIDLVRQYVQQHPDDLEGWWCAANIVPNPRIKMQAVQKVLQINPNHAKAKQMLAKLQSMQHGAQQPAVTRTTENPFEYKASLPQTGPFTAPIEEVDQPPPSSAVRATRGGATLPSTGPLDLTISKKKPDVAISDETAWTLVGIVVVVAIILIGGVIYWYTQIRDTSTDLEFSETAAVEEISIKYPEDWNVRTHDSSRIVVINKATATENLNPWQVLVDNGTLPEAAFVSFFESIAYSSEQENTYAYVVQPLPQSPQYLIDIMVGTWQSYYDDGLFEGTFADLTTNREALEVDGTQAVFSGIELNVKFVEGFSGISNLNVSFYFAAFNKNNQDYMFTMMVFEDDNDVEVERNWEAEAKKIAQTISIAE